MSSSSLLVFNRNLSCNFWHINRASRDIQRVSLWKFFCTFVFGCIWLKNRTVSIGKQRVYAFWNILLAEKLLFCVCLAFISNNFYSTVLIAKLFKEGGLSAALLWLTISSRLEKLHFSSWCDWWKLGWRKLARQYRTWATLRVRRTIGLATFSRKYFSARRFFSFCLWLIEKPSL